MLLRGASLSAPSSAELSTLLSFIGPKPLAAFSFTKKTVSNKNSLNIPLYIVTLKVLCDHLLLAVRGGPSYSASQYRYA